MEKVTLKQIAQQAGVSLTTVHRVLNGKGGCSKKVEENILRIAREQGYAINMAASSLRKQPIHIALVFPLMGEGGHYFVNRILDGYLMFRQEVSQFNVLFQEFYFRSLPELEQILKQIYRDQPVHYDGVVIYGLSIDAKSEAIVNRIEGSGTKVVVLERAPKGLEDICSVEVNDTVAGNLAGDMLCKCIHDSGTVMIIDQQLAGGDPNGVACASCIAEFRPDLKTVRIPLALEVDQSQAITQVLQRHPDLVGVYATCARHTHSLLRALQHMDLNPQSVIGSELFAESYQALQDHTLDAVIGKRPEQIGYKALQLLFNALVKHEPLPTIHRVTPRIILRANSDIYYIEKENLYGKTRYPE